MAKEVPPEGDVIDGKFIPGGCQIGYCGFGIFRNKKIWGEDADIFRPERWLEGSPASIKEAESILDLVFGGGRWQCLGRKVAQMELNKVFVEVCMIYRSLGWGRFVCYMLTSLTTAPEEFRLRNRRPH